MNVGFIGIGRMGEGTVVPPGERARVAGLEA